MKQGQAELNSELEASREEISKLTQQINTAEQQLSRVSCVGFVHIVLSGLWCYKACTYFPSYHHLRNNTFTFEFDFSIKQNFVRGSESL